MGDPLSKARQKADECDRLARQKFHETRRKLLDQIERECRNAGVSVKTKAVRAIRWVCVILSVLALSACGSIDSRFVKAVDGLYREIHADYVKLLREKSGYDDSTINVRTIAADELKKLIDEAKE